MPILEERIQHLFVDSRRENGPCKLQLWASDIQVHNANYILPAAALFDRFTKSGGDNARLIIDSAVMLYRLLGLQLGEGEFRHLVTIDKDISHKLVADVLSNNIVDITDAVIQVGNDNPLLNVYMGGIIAEVKGSDCKLARDMTLATYASYALLVKQLRRNRDHEGLSVN